jgi:hypothetical protein
MVGSRQDRVILLSASQIFLDKVSAHMLKLKCAQQPEVPYVSAELGGSRYGVARGRVSSSR